MKGSNDHKRVGKIIFKKAIWRLQDNIVQWLWFVFGVKKDRIGFDKGLLTWQRESRHRNLRRNVHICLLEVNPKEGKFGRFTAFWINERSRICSASLNERIEDADVLWVYSQDPLPPESKEELLQMVKRAKEGTPVINHPDVYNSYHEEYAFRALENAGVSVPRSMFTERDVGKTLVVYKIRGKHWSPKLLSLYHGPIEGYRPFEFVDSKGPDGLYRQYRVLYVAEIIHPNYVAFSHKWNVERTNREHFEYTFEINPVETESIHLIARTLNIQYFSVDYLRRSSDNLPFFTDINVYPLPVDFTETAREFGYYGRWHLVDNRVRLGIPEPSGRPFWENFDEAMLSFAGKTSQKDNIFKKTYSIR